MDTQTITEVAECIHWLKMEADAYRIKYHSERARADELAARLAKYESVERVKTDAENALETIG